jgi:hypothetical protein
MNISNILTRSIVILTLAGCTFEGTEPYRDSQSVIATRQDQGRDPGVLANGEAAIAYDPDGCQVWIIDDGLEGYSTPRYDPRTGLPVCDTRYPPGTVLNTYQTTSEGLDDRVSGPSLQADANP